MTIPTCCYEGSVIQNWAMNKSFYVCTKCKQEVVESPQPTVVMATYPGRPTPLEILAITDFEQLELFDPWLDGNTLANNPKDNQDDG